MPYLFRDRSKMKKYAGIEFYIPYEKDMSRGFVSAVSDTLYIEVAKNGEVKTLTLYGTNSIDDGEFEVDITMPKEEVLKIIDGYQAAQNQSGGYAKAFLEGFKQGCKAFR